MLYNEPSEVKSVTFIYRVLLLMLFLGTSSVWAQNLLPTPISTAPYFFNATPMNVSMPYQLPNYWQQQQPNFMESLLPAFNNFSSMLAQDLEGYDDERIEYFEESDNNRRRNRNFDAYTYSRREARSEPSSSTTTTPAAAVARTTEHCTDCETNTGTQPAVISSEAERAVASVQDVSASLLDSSLRTYEQSSEVQKMITAIRRDATLKRDRRRKVVGNKPKDESLGRCLMYVKFGLVESGLFPSYPSGLNAAYFGRALTDRGFSNIMSDGTFNITDPAKAPIGSVIVYEDTRTTIPGHIEVKLGANEYGSDYISDRPRSETSATRKVIGIYVKLPEGES